MTQRCITEKAEKSLALKQYGLWIKSHKMLAELQHDISREKDERNFWSEYEKSMVQEEWSDCAKKLNNWHEVCFHAQEKQNPYEIENAAWRIAPLPGVKSFNLHAVNTKDKAMVRINEDMWKQLEIIGNSTKFGHETFHCKILEYYRILRKFIPNNVEYTQKLRQIESDLQRAAIKEFENLPNFFGQAHLKMLHRFHQYVEITICFV